MLSSLIFFFFLSIRNILWSLKITGNTGVGIGKVSALAAPDDVGIAIGAVETHLAYLLRRDFSVATNAVIALVYCAHECSLSISLKKDLDRFIPFR